MLLLVVASALALAAGADEFRLKLLDNTAANGAICLDGSPGGARPAARG
jgi:hypothetical protein